MRVLHLCTSDSGGAGIAASRIHHGLLQNGIQSSFLSLYSYRNSIENSYKLKDVYFSGLNAFDKTKYLFQRLIYYFKLAEHPYYNRRDKYLKNRPAGFELFSIPYSAYNLNLLQCICEADIVHLHWVTEGFMDYASFFPKVKKKIVWTLHDMNPFTGGCHHSDGCEKFKLDCANCPQLKGTIDSGFANKILVEKENSLQFLENNQLQIVAPSRWMLDLSIKSRLFGRFKHTEIPNPVDESVFKFIEKLVARKALGLPEDKKIILFIAKDVDNERKGFSYLMEALELAGDKKNIITCSVGNVAANYFTSENHRDLGYVNDELKMALIYSAADLFVLPSLAENLPNTICESLMCGTPVVAFNVGGIPSLINSQNGICVELKNSALLAEAINSVIGNKINFDNSVISQNAIEKFSMKAVIPKYQTVYSSQS